MALGGSTNAIIHLIAMAGRAGVALDLDRFDALSRRTPVLANIRPSGKYLMEDFFYAGGLRGGSMAGSRDLLHTDCLTVNGRTLGENIDGRRGLQRRTSSCPREKPHRPGRRRGRAARQPGARRRRHQAHAPASRGCCSTRGRPSSSRTTTTSRRASTIPALPVTRRFGARPAERGPARRARACRSGACCRSRRSCSQQGVRDMVRISDARMSGTSYGACVLHVAPESFVGGPLAFVRDGDIIELDVPRAASSTLRVSDEELARRRAGWTPPRVAVPARLRPRCTRSTSPRRTRAATSTSWRARRRRPSPRSTDGRGARASRQRFQARPG